MASMMYDREQNYDGWDAEEAGPQAVAFWSV